MRKGLKYLLLLLSVMTIGCTKENLEDCFSGVNLRFRFTLHEEPMKGNLFGQNIKHVRVYIFDESGILRQIETGQGGALSNDYVMPIDLKPGRYSLVAWASDDVEFSHSYKQLHAVDLSQKPPKYTELEVGKSRMEDLRIALDCQDAPAYPEDTKPVMDNFDDLYFGAVGTRSDDGESLYTIIPLEVKESEVVEREVELIRNTNIVRITIEGTDHLAGQNAPFKAQESLDIWANGINSSYLYNNKICPKTPSVRYLPQYSTPTANITQADIKIERLEWGTSMERRVKLNVKLKDGKTLYAGDLLSLLRQAKNGQGKNIYNNQEDLDRIYIHPIRFVIADDSGKLSVKIFIHDWEVVNVIPEL